MNVSIPYVTEAPQREKKISLLSKTQRFIRKNSRDGCFFAISKIFKNRPRILNHVLTAIHADGIRVPLLIFIGITIDLIDIN